MYIPILCSKNKPEVRFLSFVPVCCAHTVMKPSQLIMAMTSSSTADFKFLEKKIEKL